jgi:ubiquinone/menaquinone biosynthesis C-methylase UbiE
VPDELIQDQIAYYDARAAEYDRMLSGLHRYERDGLDPASPDPETRELAEVAAALTAAGLTGDVLELACGSGWWTRRLREMARSVTAVDASARMLAICRERAGADNVTLIQSDIFEWEPDRAYDGVFFGFWLSHVPPDRFDEFWSKVARALKPGAPVFFVDEAKKDPVDAEEEQLGDGRGATIRPLEDGRRFRMVKVYMRPDELEARLRAAGWTATVVPTGGRFFHGLARRAG